MFEIRWPALVTAEVAAEMLRARSILKGSLGVRLKDLRFGYHCLSVSIRRGSCDADEIMQLLDIGSAQRPTDPAKRWLIPVCYDSTIAKDLESYLKEKGMGLDELIALHAGANYLLHFYGFLPGFMYLGGLDPALHHPRKGFPDRRVEIGSVAIGGSQTGIYPVESLGGWHVVGRTPITIFDPMRGHLPPFTPGDSLCFFSIDLKEYQQRLIHGATDWEYER